MAPNVGHAQFVTDLYWTYPQRAPDTGGYQAWLNAVPVYGRTAVRDGFAYSGEFSGLVSRIFGINTDDNQRALLFVYKLYSALARDPSNGELSAGIDRLNNAAAQGQSQVIAEAQAYAREIFTSTEYVNRNRNDRDYVMDLYLATVQRAPDTAGWDAWTSAVASSGRTTVREGFLTSGEFQYLASTLYREAFWLVSDQLGTARIVVDKSGSSASVKRHDYLPFGEEIGGIEVGLIGGRLGTPGYVLDSVRQKFTGYENDIETGLNYAQARYQSSMQGRFTSVDPLGQSATITNPQSFNRYSYVLNNPTGLTDPSGLMAMDPGMDYNGAEPSSSADDPPGDPFEKGSDIIATAMARFDNRVADTTLANGLNNLIASGRMTLDEAEEAIKGNGNLAIDVYQEPQETISTTHNDPVILNYKVKYLDKTPQGEVPVGGQFEITYKYQISIPTDGSRPEHAGRIEPVGKTGSFVDAFNLGIVGEPKTKTNRQKESIVVEKTERFIVNDGPRGALNATGALNYRIAVTAPNGSGTVTRSKASSWRQPLVGLGPPKPIEVRNVPLQRRRRVN